ncbi:MAG: TolC family protein [Nibricoccus sp.]
MKRTPFLKLILLAFAGGLLLSVAAKENAAAGEPEILSLDSAIQIALQANAELQAASGRVEAASARAYQARAWANPEVEIGVDDWPVRESGGYSRSKRTIGLSQSVPFPGKRSLEKQIGAAGVKVSSGELADFRADLIRDVKIWFFRVIALENQVKVQAELQESAEASASIAKKRVDNGAAPYPEQLRAEVQVEQTRTKSTDLKRDLALAQRCLAALLGRTKLERLRLTGVLVDKENAALTNGFTAEMLNQHPRLQTAQANVERAELGYRRARLEPYPDVRVGVAGGRVGEENEAIGQVTLSVPVPVWDRGTGKRREAKADVAVATAELQKARQQLLRDWANAVQRYRTASEQVAAYREKILPRTAEALRLVCAGFEEGKFGFTDLADTQRTTGEVQMAYQEKLLELNEAQAELEALLPSEQVNRTN